LISALRHLRAEADVQALLLELARGGLGDVGVGGSRNSGSASRMVTSEPRRRHTLPSSRPITPEPITPRRLGTASTSSAPALSRISLLSYFAKGSSIGTEPAAMMTCLPLISATLPSWPLMLTTRLAFSVPKPAIGVTGWPCCP
jgi:hypothetical protein